MRSYSSVSGLLLLVCGSAWGQPVIQGYARNAASYAGSYLPNSGVAQGAMFVLKGTGFGACGTRLPDAIPLQTSMGGTSVRITVGGVSKDAYMIHVVACRGSGLPDQVSAIAPSDTPLGNGTVAVAFNGATSAGAPIQIVARAFGLFTLNMTGGGPAVVQNFTPPASYVVNSLDQTIRPGQTGVIWGTGLGARRFNDAAPPPAYDNLKDIVEVWVGSVPATVTYAGASGYPAVEQINFTTPDLEGCYHTLAVRVGGVISNLTTISVAKSGNICSDANGFSTADLNRFLTSPSTTIGSLVLTRTVAHIEVPPVMSLDTTMDMAAGGFMRTSFSQLAAAGGSSASLGSCTIFYYDGPVSPGAGIPAMVDAGPALTLTGPRGQVQVPKNVLGAYGATLGCQPTNPTCLTPPYLDPGQYTMSIPGGTAVGAATATLSVPASPVWTNQAAITTVNRSQNLRLTWTGADSSSWVTVTGTSVNTESVGASFVCQAPAAPGEYTVPPFVLSAIPANMGGLGLTVSRQSRFTAPGCDYCVFTHTAGGASVVTFQ
jgi:uncharacterized protein (TIGR03437 family)